MLLADDRLAQDAANLLLNTHFPQSMHGDIREAVGLRDIEVTWEAGTVRDAPYTSTRSEVSPRGTKGLRIPLCRLRIRHSFG